MTAGGKLISGSSDNTIKIWSTTTWICERTLTDHTDDVDALALTPDGRKLLSGSDDMTVKIWDTASWVCERTLQCDRPVWSLLVSGSTVFIGQTEGTLDSFNWETGEKVGTLAGHSRAVRCFALSGGKLCSASWDRTIKVWA